MIIQKIKALKNLFEKGIIDGYVVPKNDEFFSEFSKIDRLKIISNFTGSAGYAVILKNKNYLFVDGRYTIQAKIESGKNFIITEYHKIVNCDLFKNLTLGINPKLFTSNQIKKYFLKNNKIKLIETDLIKQNSEKKLNHLRPFFSLDKHIVGESHKRKINKIIDFLKINKSNFIFITAPENVAWLLNIRGYDNPNSPIPNCHLLLDRKKNFYLITDKRKTKNLIKEKKVKPSQIIDPNNFQLLIKKLNGNKIIIDSKTCSIFYEKILKTKFKILSKEDPIYMLKAVKNKKEIKNMINAHISDGLALTKFLYWIKNINKKKITEFDAQNKLEQFRKKNKDYLFPSFNTIAGTGSNGAIIHYRATKKSNKIIRKNDIFLCDSGGQYKFGTTDVTRTICFSNPKKIIKNIFTRVLKGHISVAQTNLSKFSNGRLIDIKARKFLKKINLDYEHGTGHGVGFFSNVHEGPQSLSKYNKIKICEGMILSNEPGYYKKGKFGIRIENLVYVKKVNKKLFFENLTLAPIDTDLINPELLTNNEKDYLSKYNSLIYSKLSKFLNTNERKWISSFI
ncbi:aminopeptidase P family protein [Candidatus Pelagibacter sp.]|nr:aminopeptidase P family protein [Candidatus Pelagibacter sp.]